ncbi:amino acid permease-domain-containing protein [Aspergillus novoparasiticus]|uniref:Amino acid permease-domain-containing protein n=1 Tax=Aspergillus novoparasiticus TaxID=986946 RepID=A0A5N6EQ19_9EURO|nr:amino acid permease-domain-containing protein [Aspergillus novoparasiticus]
MWGIWGLWGIQYSVTGAPVAIGTYLSVTIGLGGSPAYIWGFIMMGLFQLTTCLAVAELASAIPHSSASPGFIIAPWQTYLVYFAYALLSLSINLPRTFKVVNYMLRAVIFTLNGTAIWLLVALLVRAYPKQSSHAVFIEFVNQSGWSSDGLVFFLALLPAYGAFAGLDNATYLTDELEVPQVIIGSFFMNSFTALPMIVVYQFCNGDLQSLLDPIGGQPMIQLMLNAFHSLPLTIATTAIMIYSFFVSSAASMITWSRLYWSFSREGPMPFSRTMSKLTSRDNLPIYAICWNTVLLIAIGAISIGSTTAMNALLGAANICIITAMVTAFALSLYKGRKTFDQNHWFNLGRWGDPIFWLATL